MGCLASFDDVLTHLLLCCVSSPRQVVRGTVEAVNESGGSADASRLEAWTLSAALLSRVLHRLFQFNASYCEVRFFWRRMGVQLQSYNLIVLGADAGAVAAFIWGGGVLRSQGEAW